ncbi:MAG: hypothetical protein LBK99_08760 [Opitutaceae bacterium]|nr:hypothetical protein [Opitutaceae bacterium]
MFIAEGTSLLSREDWIGPWIAWAEKHFPNQFGVDLNATRFTGTGNVIKRYNQAGIPVMLETHVSGAIGRPAMYNHGLFATRYDGFTPNNPVWRKGDLRWKDITAYNAPDFTHPEVLELLSADMLAAFRQGFESCLLMDYVWPYFGGKWGYGEHAVRQWKAYLKQEDSHAIALVSPDENWTFANYWKHFTAIPLAPPEFGWKTWDDFQCGDEFSTATAEAGKRLRLFNALWHYHYLVFLDKLGRMAEGRGKLAISVNPEDINNGTDMSLLSRLRHLHILGIEYFGSPRALNALAHTLPHLRRIQGGPQIDLVGEINGGGHGPSRYDRDVAFAYYYGSATTVLPLNYNTQYVEQLWPEYGRLNNEQKGRFIHWFAGARAFLLRHQEESALTYSPPRLTVVASRSILDYQPGSTHSLAQARNVAAIVADLNFDFLQVGRDIWNAGSYPETDILVWSPTVSTEDELRRAKAWIESGKNKTLITHGGSPYRLDTSPETIINPPVLWNEHRSYREDHIKDGKNARGTVLLPSVPQAASREIVFDGQKETMTVWNVAGVPGAKHLVVSADGTPLLTEFTRSNGNRILHIAPDLTARSSLSKKLLGEALSQAKARGFANPLTDWQIKKHPVPGGDVFTAWHVPTLDRQAEPPGNKKHYASRIFGKEERVDHIEVYGIPDTGYVVHFTFEKGSKQIRSDKRGIVSIPLRRTPELIYLGRDTDDFRTTIQRVTTARDTVLQWTEQAR